MLDHGVHNIMCVFPNHIELTLLLIAQIGIILICCLADATYF